MTFLGIIGPELAQKGGVLKKVFKDFLDDDCPSLAAALAYYTVFALPAVLFLLLTVVGLFIDPRSVQERLVGEFGGLIGPKGAATIETMVASASTKASGNALRVVLGVAMLLFGATGAFMQLQKALNRAWEVKPDPKQGGIKNFLLKRLLSFGVLLTLAFLMIVSLVASALIAAFGNYLGNLVGGLAPVLLQGLQFVLSFVILAVLFGVIFKYLPDAEISWRDARVGGLVTAALFSIGKFAIGYYLGRSDPGSAFGAAGALAIILVWVYYTSMIMLVGAEFTQGWAFRRGEGIRPEKGAVRMTAA